MAITINLLSAFCIQRIYYVWFVFYIRHKHGKYLLKKNYCYEMTFLAMFFTHRVDVEGSMIRMKTEFERISNLSETQLL